MSRNYISGRYNSAIAKVHAVGVALKSAAQWLADEGFVTLSPADELPSIATFVSGEMIKGNWWSHARANEIYNLFQKLSSSPNVVVLKLIDGKVTLVHKRLWPPLLRLVTDSEQRTKRLKKLNPAARMLLDQVETHGSVRMDFIADEMGGNRKALKKSRDLLERLCLVASRDEHTRDGHHEAVLETWPTIMKRKSIRIPKSLTVEAALSAFEEKLGKHRIPFSM